MSVTSAATTTWSGGLEGGGGSTTLASSGLGTFDVHWKARSAGSSGVTTPEELLGAALSSCYSMALSHTLGGKGLTADKIDVRAEVTFVPGEGITGIALTVEAAVPGMNAEDFAAVAEEVKGGCPVSAALAGTTMTLAKATLTE